MKSKIRSITVDGRDYRWSVKEIDWDNVLLTVWVEGVKNRPWFTTEKRFNNPWYFLGQINEKTIPKLQLKPITPKHVAAAIKLVMANYGCPNTVNETLQVKITEDGKISKV